MERRLMQSGFFLFLLGLLTGFAVPALSNPRMGLASHLEAILNGMLLVVIGLVWTRLSLGRGVRIATFALLIYGTFANWVATLLAAWWGAGRSMPLAAGAHRGTPMQEGVIDFLLFSLSASMVVAVILVLWGLRGSGDSRQAVPSAGGDAAATP